MLYITNIQNESTKFDAISQTLSDSFYSAEFDFRVFTYAAESQDFSNSLTPNDLDVKAIFKPDPEFLKGIAPQMEINTISFDVALSKIRTFLGYKGNAATYDIIEDFESSYCEKAFSDSCAIIFASLHFYDCKNVPRVFNIISISESLKQLGKSFLTPKSPWGFCLLFLNDERKKGCLLLASGFF